MITEESFVDFECPYCHEPVSFPQTDAGLARACPNCNETVVVPSPGAEKDARLPIPITTPRLILRRLTGADWQDLLEFMGKDEAFRYTSGGPLEEEDVLRWLEADHLVRLTTPEQTFHLGVQMVQGGKLVGTLGLRFIDPLQVTINVIINPAFQRQGLGTEALHALLNFCFRGIHLHRVMARCDSRNNPGIKLLEHVGMRREGEFIQDTPSHEGWLNTVCFAILREEMERSAAASS